MVYWLTKMLKVHLGVLVNQYVIVELEKWWIASIFWAGRSHRGVKTLCDLRNTLQKASLFVTQNLNSASTTYSLTRLSHYTDYVCRQWSVYSAIAFDETVIFWASTRLVTALSVCVCCIICTWGSHITITQSHTHMLRQTRTHKPLNRHVET